MRVVTPYARANEKACIHCVTIVFFSSRAFGRSVARVHARAPITNSATLVNGWPARWKERTVCLSVGPSSVSFCFSVSVGFAHLSPFTFFWRHWFVGKWNRTRRWMLHVCVCVCGRRAQFASARKVQVEFNFYSNCIHVSWKCGSFHNRPFLQCVCVGLIWSTTTATARSTRQSDRTRNQNKTIAINSACRNCSSSVPLIMCALSAPPLADVTHAVDASLQR